MIKRPIMKNTNIQALVYSLGMASKNIELKVR